MQVLTRGLSASPGRFRGFVKLVRNEDDISDTIKPNLVLAIRFFTPFYFALIPNAGALVTDLGGVTCHAAGIARELGIPCVVGTGNATDCLKEGMEVLVDADEGVVYGLSH